MSNNNLHHPYWGRAIQQAGQKPAVKTQPRQPQQPQAKRQKLNDHGGFDSLIVGRKCLIKLGDGDMIKGTVSATSKYWYLVTVGEQVVIVNKAYIMAIIPGQTQDGNNQQNTSAPKVMGDEERR
jgi:hypothetical protein